MCIRDSPKPLSTNRLFKNKRAGRVCTQEYNTWKWQAKAKISDQGWPKSIGPVRIRFIVGEMGLRADMDGDNCLKCLLDALVDNKVIEDDKRSIVRAVGMEWHPDTEGAVAILEPANFSPVVEYRGVVA